MATTEAQVRKHLDPEEPNYVAAAAELGAEALPILETLVQRADPLLASKATYLASLIPDAQADRVLEQAARSAHPSVRIAAAAGLEKRPEVSNDVAAELMADPDAGVRKVAAKTARGRAPSARERTSEGSPEDHRAAPGKSATTRGARSAQVLEGEHGGGFSPGGTEDADHATGEGGGEVGETRARSATVIAGTDRESGGGGDLGGGLGSRTGGSGDAPDGGGLLSDKAGDGAASMHGGGNI